MKSSTNNSFNLTEFVEKHFVFIKKAEVISIVIFLTGFILYGMKLPNSHYIFITGCLVVAIVYFLNVFKVREFENIETWENTNIFGTLGFINFLYKLTFMGLSISAISLLGLVFTFPDKNPLFACGGMTLLIALILTLFTKLKEKSKIYDVKFYLRIIIVLIFLGIYAFEKI